MTTKTITIKKRGGGTRKQKVQVLKSGKFKFIKNSASSTKRKVKRKTSKTSRKVKRVIKKASPKRTMAKRRRSTKSRSSSKGIMSTVKRFAKPIAIGLGVAPVLALGAGAVGQPQLAQNKLVGAAAAFILGGPVAGGAALLLGGGLGNIFGGSSNGGGNMV